MPDSTTDRPTRSHEYVFLLTKSERYYYDNKAILEPLASSSIARIQQESFDSQKGGPKDYANGTNANRSARKTLENFRDKTLASPRLSGQRQAPEPGEEGWATAEGRNKRTVWTIATSPYAEAHFATFPEALVEPCILAASAAKACGVCGAPWGRVTKRTDEVDESAKGSYFDKGKTGARDGGERTQPGERFRKVTVGFQPTCEHDDGSAASRVLDPFNGSGTTGAVALRLGREYVGTDLSREYLAMAERRLGAVTPVAQTVEHAARVAGNQGVQLTLGGDL